MIQAQASALVNAEDLFLVRRVLAGEQDALQALMKKYERRIFAICVRITCNEGAAEEAVQETFVRAYFALSRYDQQRPFLPWLTRIAVNRAITIAGRERAYQPLPEAFHELAHGEDGTAAAGGWPAGQLERAARDAVASLPPKLRAVLALRIFEELSYDEIADALKISIGTVMSRLSRGRAKLQSKLFPAAGPVAGAATAAAADGGRHGAGG